MVARAGEIFASGMDVLHYRFGNGRSGGCRQTAFSTQQSAKTQAQPRLALKSAARTWGARATTNFAIRRFFGDVALTRASSTA